ncbi:bromodomain associated [Dictyocaulus viviparus]|uniref:Transcription initiation factor TFIID subunit 8 n=1 Tax=Dictyocaulus viviparus TaxID=29172 RepID=A0A0D8Y3H4_DICVI|nr:bromodomain associated [Dictyocaulus viviparus]
MLVIALHHLISCRGDGDIPPELWPEDDPYEQVIRQSVAAICSSVGFDAIDANMLGILAQRLRNYICSICLGAKLNCEVAGRNILIASDVWLALADIGHKIDQLPGYLRHLRVTGTIAIAPPRERQEPSMLPPMLVGQSRPHPPYVHEFFPAFPEPHTYIHTEISGEPDLTYEAVRKTAAQRRREMERSLINYMMCMHSHITLFPQFEAKIRNEAKQYLRDVEKERESRKQRRESAKGVINKMICPMPEMRPYMSCLRSDDMKEKGFYDDDDDEELEKKESSEAVTLSRTANTGGAGDGGGDDTESHGQIYDNPYIRIAQLQRKELKFLRENMEIMS